MHLYIGILNIKQIASVVLWLAFSPKQQIVHSSPVRSSQTQIYFVFASSLQSMHH